MYVYWLVKDIYHFGIDIYDQNQPVLCEICLLGSSVQISGSYE